MSRQKHSCRARRTPDSVLVAAPMLSKLLASRSRRLTLRVLFSLSSRRHSRADICPATSSADDLLLRHFLERRRGKLQATVPHWRGTWPSSPFRRPEGCHTPNWVRAWPEALSWTKAVECVYSTLLVQTQQRRHPGTVAAGLQPFWTIKMMFLRQQNTAPGHPPNEGCPSTTSFTFGVTPSL